MTLNPERLLELIGKMLSERDSRLAKAMDDKIELARVNADLRLEQAHSQLKEMRDLYDSAVEFVEELKSELAIARKAAAEWPEHVGAFANGQAYRRNHIVSRDGSTYICAVDSTTSDPRDNDGESWRLLAMRGERGAKGDAGATGARGEPGTRGEKGDPGRPGADGKIGKTGERGPRGEPGIPGKKGDSGQDGREMVAADIIGSRLAFTMNDGDVLSVNLKKAIEAGK